MGERIRWNRGSNKGLSKVARTALARRLLADRKTEWVQRGGTMVLAVRHGAFVELYDLEVKRWAVVRATTEGGER